MKIYLKNVFLLAIVAIAFSCATKQEDGKEAEKSEETTEQREWKEMDEFHMVMAETFHPYKDSANLEPVKTRAAELQASAEKWAGTELPAKVNNDEMKGKLEELKNETAALTQTIAGGDDKTIGEKLTKVHDLFHAIQEQWYGGHEGHGDHH